jgi:hypothetical protein
MLSRGSINCFISADLSPSMLSTLSNTHISSTVRSQFFGPIVFFPLTNLWENSVGNRFSPIDSVFYSMGFFFISHRIPDCVYHRSVYGKKSIGPMNRDLRSRSIRLPARTIASSPAIRQSLKYFTDASKYSQVAFKFSVVSIRHGINKRQ